MYTLRSEGFVSRLCGTRAVATVGRRFPVTSRVVAFLLLVQLVSSVVGEPCFIISEVNADNPKLDATEFVELYHTSGKKTSLAGYTLVFYNGNGNVAYKVLDLNGYATDDRGFFLVGSADVQPKPAVILPPNTVQNGPDAIALYHGEEAQYSEKMNLTTVGLVDAIVYATRRSRDAEFLADVLTPGSPAFLEDDSVHEGDESIERCWLSAGSWTFHVSPPSPGQHNLCPAPESVDPRINELQLGGGQTVGFVELVVPQPSDSMVLVLLDGKTTTVTFSMDISPTAKGLFLITSRDSGLAGDAVFFPGNLSVLKPHGSSSGAVALYNGTAADFLVGNPLNSQQPLDAFVYAESNGEVDANVVETLIPGREVFQLSSRVDNEVIALSRCGAATWNRDPGVFVEAVQTPGQPNDCLWPLSCPQKVVTPEGTAPPLQPPPWDPTNQQDFLLNEVNADTPGDGEDSEFVEIWHPAGRRMSLDGVWLLLFSGHNGKPYREISLTGYFTDAQGYFLVGSDKMIPAPSISLPPNTIQNGPDAVALYRSANGPPSVLSAGIPTQGLLDAVVYRQSAKEARDLSDALTPGQLPLLEDSSFLAEDESLSRCNSLLSADLSSFMLTSPTPLGKNTCPNPPAGVVINEISSAHWSGNASQEAFVELLAPPLTELHGLVLLVFDEQYHGAAIALRLTGTTGHDGFYLIGNVTGADQTWPPWVNGAAVPSQGVVALCYGPLCSSKAGLQGANSSLVDTVVFTKDQHLLSILGRSKGQQVTPALRTVEGPVSLSRCSCCEVRSPLVWTASAHTPRLENLCPSSTFSSNIDLCLGPPGTDGEQHFPNCSGWRSEDGGGQEVEVALYLEEQCHCGISPLYLREANFSCAAGRLSVQGSIQALSARQRELILQASRDHWSRTLGNSCSNTIVDKSVGERSGLGYQIGLVVGALLLVALGAALFAYFYKKRRPQDYYSMELNEHVEEAAEL
ncbi:uncharacterized protein LOC108923954 [Scleropages formosus]|uniref:Si:ch211-183d21.1 n=1 Tax=Scleropages formosus TaxID=113540 RepID=A0A8C9SCN4_SCLFO|nr:uncharacterized protein LOC108923954 [Scleropages formosus]XP_029102760.1 uncharacterized protein LOC108923954 [Scleropages formosus]